MTSEWIVATTTAAGAVTAALCRASTERVRNTYSATSWMTGSLAAGVIAAAMSAAIAVRIDRWPELVMLVYLVTVGMSLASIDILERRLPNALLRPSYAIVATILAADAISRSDLTCITRSVICMALTSGFYLTLAVVSRGGLGAGDVKLGGLLGLSLGWIGWTCVALGTTLGWTLAAIYTFIRRPAGRALRRDETVPLGPFLLAGAFVAVLLFA